MVEGNHKKGAHKLKLTDLIRHQPHQLLGVEKDASQNDIRVAMRQKCMAFHHSLTLVRIVYDTNDDTGDEAWRELLVAYRLLLKEPPALLVQPRNMYLWHAEDIVPTLRPIEEDAQERQGRGSKMLYVSIHFVEEAQERVRNRRGPFSDDAIVEQPDRTTPHHTTPHHTRWRCCLVGVIPPASSVLSSLHSRTLPLLPARVRHRALPPSSTTSSS